MLVVKVLYYICDETNEKGDMGGKEEEEIKKKGEKEWGLRCLHGPRRMCARCASNETVEERFEKVKKM